MNRYTLTRLKAIIRRYPQIKLAYLFGSAAKNKMGPLSDYDFAIYVAERKSIRARDIQFQLQADISRLLRTDRVDVVLLNFLDSPELKYAIVRDGRLLVEREPFKIIFEPRALNEYFDFKEGLKRYQLTKAAP